MIKDKILKEIDKLTLNINLLRYYIMKTPYAESLSNEHLILVKMKGINHEVSIQKKLHYRTLK